jgi:hypothetical protein
MKKLIVLIQVSVIAFAAKSQSWTITGNGNTNPAIHFLGTTNNQPLKFRINNQYAGEIDSVKSKTFFGYGAGKNTDSNGIRNVGIGFKALQFNTGGTENTAIGHQALLSNTTGYSNTASGSQSLLSNITGIYNTATGTYALFYNTTGSANTASGSQALYSNMTGYHNTANGYVALQNNTSGIYNTATGSNALNANTTGYYNTATGVSALQFNTTGHDNIATGLNCLYYNTTGNYNTATGTYALFANTTGSFNTANGHQALYYNSFGNYNAATGYQALLSNTTGLGNTANGYQALYYNSSGQYNAANGPYALYSNTTGSFNTANGYYALYSNTTGSRNTACGYGANVSSGSLTYATAIGGSAIVDASYKVRIGSVSVGSIGGQVGWSTFSDGRYKQQIKEDVPGIAFITKLKPVTYTVDIKNLNSNYYKIKKEDDIAAPDAGRQTGFIAQDVEKAAKELGFTFSGIDKPQTENGLYGLRYAEFVVPLVKAVQEQQQIIDELKKQNADLLLRIAAIEKRSGLTNLSPDNSNRLQTWPNPGVDNITLQIISDSKSEAMIKISDSKGVLVNQRRLSLSAGNNQVSIDISKLASGIYHLSAEWENVRAKQSIQLIKQ